MADNGPTISMSVGRKTSTASAVPSLPNSASPHVSSTCIVMAYIDMVYIVMANPELGVDPTSVGPRAPHHRSWTPRRPRSARHRARAGGMRSSSGRAERGAVFFWSARGRRRMGRRHEGLRLVQPGGKVRRGVRVLDLIGRQATAIEDRPATAPWRFAEMICKKNEREKKGARSGTKTGNVLLPTFSRPSPSCPYLYRP